MRSKKKNGSTERTKECRERVYGMRERREKEELDEHEDDEERLLKGREKKKKIKIRRTRKEVNKEK